MNLPLEIQRSVARWTRTRRGFIAAFSIAAAASVTAQPLPEDPLQRRCWLDHTRERTAVSFIHEPTEVSFIHLRSGYTVRSPFWVEFGVRGMGVIPAGNPNPKAGHHHLLIDQPLPLLYREKIPTSDTYRHFGKGQSGTLLDLPPGVHTLRLLFADHEHRPYFVYSREIRIVVKGQRSDPAPVIDPNEFRTTCAAWYQDQVSAPRGADKQVYVNNFRDGEPLVSPFVMGLGVIGYGIAPADSPIKDTGHFVVTVSRDKQQVGRTVLSNGRTETRLDLPDGSYKFQVTFERSDGTALITAPPMRIPIVSQYQ